MMRLRTTVCGVKEEVDADEDERRLCGISVFGELGVESIL